MTVRNIPLSEALIEVSSGVGPKWSEYRVLGATRAGLALAKEPVGKSPERYKLVEPGTIFYNPMRIMIGSIAMVDDGDEPGITSPDYVVFRTRPGVLHHRWFYYWLRSKYGEDLIRSLARGAVRERLLFKRLANGTVGAPNWDTQLSVAQRLSLASSAESTCLEALAAAKALPTSWLRSFFEPSGCVNWPVRPLRDVAEIVAGVTLGRNLNGDNVTMRPYLRVANVKDGYIDTAEILETPASDREYERLVLCDGDILLTEGGDRDKLGRGAVWRGQVRGCIHQNHIFRVRLDRSIADPDFVSFQIGSPYGKAYFLRHAKQTTGIASINQRVLGAFPLMLPTLAQQRRIAESLLKSLDQQSQVVNKLQQQLESIRSLVAAMLRDGNEVQPST
jgi:type I restriction enzyme S subunit